MLVLFFGRATVLFAAAWLAAGVGPLAYLGLALGAVHLGWQVTTIAIDDPDNCLMLFRSNRDLRLDRSSRGWWRTRSSATGGG